MFDAAIVGGGLAGLTAALSLRASGWSVVVLEAADYPRQRVCGEFLSPECADVLREVGVWGAVEALRPAHITRALVTTPGGAQWSRELPAPGIGLSRYALDALLAEAARTRGVDLRVGYTVTDITGTLDAGFTVAGRGETPVQARVVIGAHGKRGRPDYALERPFTQMAAEYVGLKMHYHAPPTADRVELHAFDGGYCGLSEVEGGAVNLCLLARADRLRDAGDIPAFIAWMATGNPVLGAWLADATPQLDHWQAIAQVSFARKSPVERDILMTGDAAGLISPLAGDGMGMAFEGGLLAARHIDAYLRGTLDAARLCEGYAHAWEQSFRGRLRVGRLLQAFLLRPAPLEVGVRLLNSAPPLGDFFIRRTRNLDGYPAGGP